MSLETYYDILGIGENTDDDAVKQAFRDLAKHYHPDRNPGDEEAERQFKRINTAYEGLKDASRRQAYNEWLEFAQKRTKVRRTQWGRLAALVFLLLLGPSAVLYWAVVIADIPLFADSADKDAALNQPRETSLPPPPPERRQPLSPSEPAASQQAAATPSETAPEPAGLPQVAAPAGGYTPPPPATAGDDRPRADRPTTATLPETNRDAGSSGRSSKSAKTGGPGPDKASTQALPAEQPPAETQGRSETATASQTTEGQAKSGVSPFPAADANQDEGTGPHGARATARMLAKLKEPQGAEPDSDVVPVDTPPSATENAAPPRGRGLAPGAIVDCDECPVLSMAGSNEPLGGNGRVAVSLSEITLADWDGCVTDRACPPYDGPQRGSRRDTIVEVGPRAADAYVTWLSAISQKSYRVVMSPRRRETAERRCNGSRRNGSGWEWLDDDNTGRNCPPPSGFDQNPDAPRGFRVLRRSVP